MVCKLVIPRNGDGLQVGDTPGWGWFLSWRYPGMRMVCKFVIPRDGDGLQVGDTPGWDGLLLADLASLSLKKLILVSQKRQRHVVCKLVMPWYGDGLQAGETPGWRWFASW